MQDLTHEEKVDKIYTALIGDNLGNKGLVTRIEAVEAYQAADRKMKLKISGGLLVLTAIGSSLIFGVNWILHKFNVW